MNFYHIFLYAIITVLIIKIVSLWKKNKELQTIIKWRMFEKYEYQILLSNNKTVKVLFIITPFHRDRLGGSDKFFTLIKTTLEATRYGTSDFDKYSYDNLLEQYGICGSILKEVRK